MPRWPGGHRAGPKSYSPRFEYRPGLFFNWTEAPQRTETHLRKKRLVCVPSPSLKAIIWPNSCATLNRLHCRPNTLGFPGVSTSIANCATYCKTYFFADSEEIHIHIVETWEITAVDHFENDHLQKSTMRQKSFPISAVYTESGCQDLPVMQIWSYEGITICLSF